MHTTTSQARDLVALFRASEFGSAVLDIGSICVRIEAYRSTETVTVNWPGCGDKGPATATEFAADLTRAAAIASEAERLLRETTGAVLSAEEILESWRQPIDYLGKTKNAAARARAAALPGGVEAAHAALNTPTRLTKGSL